MIPSWTRCCCGCTPRPPAAAAARWPCARPPWTRTRAWSCCGRKARRSAGSRSPHAHGPPGQHGQDRHAPPGGQLLRYADGRDLTGDEQHRLNIACAQAIRPDVPLLDEPTTGLATPTATRAAGAIRPAAAGGTHHGHATCRRPRCPGLLDRAITRLANREIVEAVTPHRDNVVVQAFAAADLGVAVIPGLAIARALPYVEANPVSIVACRARDIPRHPTRHAPGGAP
jgi:hypothetical protein